MRLRSWPRAAIVATVGPDPPGPGQRFSFPHAGMVQFGLTAELETAGVCLDPWCFYLRESNSPTLDRTLSIPLRFGRETCASRRRGRPAPST